MAPPCRARAAYPRARTAPATRPAEAARWAAALAQDPNAVILDTETTAKAERDREAARAIRAERLEERLQRTEDRADRLQDQLDAATKEQQ